MAAWRGVMRRGRAIHLFLAGRSFYPLLLSSALTCALLVERLHRLHRGAQLWIVWNLILAWVPYLASLWAAALARRRPARPAALIGPGALWLLFLPNAPYIVTDFMHLPPSTARDHPWLFWYDVMTLALCAWTGCALGAVSLRIMQGIVRRLAGGPAGWAFVLAASGLCGVGIYLGRFHRWNSWDLFVNPRGLLSDIAGGLNRPWTHARPWGMTILFAAFTLVCYLTFTSVAPGEGEAARATVAADDRRAGRG